MTAPHLERAMEDEAVGLLVAQGWRYEEGSAARYDKQRALFPEDVFEWLEATQPDELARHITPDMDPAACAKARDGLLDALASTLSNTQGGGTLHVLHKGFRRISSRFDMVQAKPTETMNPTTVERYEANILRVVRQVRYSATNPHKAIDLVLFCNGIPVATIELKTEFTQSVTRGQLQYKNDRNPGPDGRDVLLAWGKRALVHFVVTDNEVAMTTKLDGDKTTFLPFNRGDGTKKGNPLNANGARTEYFWRDVLDRDAFLTILTKYIVLRTDEKPDPITGKTVRSTSLRFPRYHQWDAVEKIVERVTEHGAGERYLIEHSAGSGKTDTIVWTAFRLAALHDADNKKIYDSVIVVTDRNVLDKQVSAAMRQLDPTAAQMVSIGGSGQSKSSELGEALAMKTPIIVVTIQTAPYALQYLREEATATGGRFAVIADEAHSSQTGKAAAKLKAVLSPEALADLADGGEVDTQDIMAAELPQRAETPNLTYLAFTATPKAKTLELFGTPDPDDLDKKGQPKPKPFHRYTMRQAITEGFILDVLLNYTEYDIAYQLGQRLKDGSVETVDKQAAHKAATRWVMLHEHNITQKVDIIIRHFRENVAGMLGGSAKAMIVTSSRKHALRYYNAVKRYLNKHHIDDIQALVAFSGKVTVSDKDKDHKPDKLLPVGEYTEANINTGTRGKPLDEAFNGPDYQVMIVANKFQVGFDQPLLCAMYVDKRLDGVLAVQTLSRLNRTWDGKDRVFVLDFVNKGTDILEAFLPYHEGATLESTTDPELVNRLAIKLDHIGLDRIYTMDEVEKAAAAEVDPKGTHNALTAALDPGELRYRNLMSEAVDNGDEEARLELEGFRSDLSNYVKAYDFLSQIIPYGVEMESRSIYYRLLARKLANDHAGVTVAVDSLVLTKFKVKDKGQVKLKLSGGEATPLSPLSEMGTAEARERDQARWSEIIDLINSLFADSDLSADDAVPEIENILRDAKKDQDLVAKARANSDADFNGDAGVVATMLTKFIDRRERSEEIINALLQGQNLDGFQHLLAMLGFREYLADETKGTDCYDETPDHSSEEDSAE
ncbi:type I restriction endonuclease subunit R [Corynebacterium qintianiae]|uniref:type I restriction endonuclease subunit R n=1 Tax=Corynebacterium qintianiae TaxID=2709392 RepID=UPI0013EAE9A0|nr:DEAD/DEAH box helicase family protein [Corynebacterium qintianiae]